MNETPEPQTPLVSIICRTMGRPELREALASAAGQTHPRLEIILVDAAARGEAACRADCGEMPVALTLPNSPLSRPQAANFGLERAQGDYLLFLDDDDWLDPEHVGRLLAFLANQSEVRAAYSSTRKTDAAGKATLETFRQAFDRWLLMRDNYIPIHSMLFARSLLEGESGCRFDENFDVFEDWDFWLQLSERTDFRHLDHCTAFYRAGGASGTADLDHHLQRFDPEHELGKARSAVYNKWLKRWTGDQLNQLLGASQREWAASIRRIGELGRELERLALAKQKADAQVGELRRKSELGERRLNDARDTHSRMEARLNAMIHSLQLDNSSLHDAVRELRSNLESALNSRSWKITRPYRAFGSWLKARSGRPLPPPLSVETLRKAPAPDLPANREGSQREPAAASRDSAKSSRQAKPSATRDFKAAFDHETGQTLAEFLASGEKLVIPEAEHPDLAILLVFYNQAHLSLLCLRALIENADAPFELIIVDNASSDRTGELLDRVENRKLIRNSENRGFVKAVNQGAELAEADYLLLLNNDAFIEPGALGAALARLRNEDRVGAVGGRVHLLDGTLQEAGNIIWRDGSCSGYGRGGSPHDGAYRFRRDVDYCSGAFLMFATGKFRELGGLDEAFAPAYYEESDFCLRLREQGLRIIYEPGPCCGTTNSPAPAASKPQPRCRRRIARCFVKSTRTS